MANKHKPVGKGEEDLVKDSSLMLSIDEVAHIDKEISLVGGEAYTAQYSDKLNINQVINLKEDEQAQDKDKVSFGFGLVIIFVVLLIICIIMAVLFLI